MTPDPLTVERACSCTGCTGHAGACGDVRPVTRSQMKTMRRPVLCVHCSRRLRSAKTWPYVQPVVARPFGSAGRDGR